MENRLFRLINFLNNSFLFKVIFFVLFSVAYYLILKDLILWRDDAKPALLVFWNHSFLDLYNGTRHELTPLLFHYTVWLVNKFIVITPEILKIINFTFYLMVVSVICFLLKIPNLIRLLILLQTPLICYSSYMRQYILAILFIFLFTYCIQKNNGKKLSEYIMLFFLTQSCFHGALIAFYLLIFIGIKNYFEEKKIYLKEYLLVLLGVILCALQMVSPGDNITHLKSFNELFNYDDFVFLLRLIIDVSTNDLIIGVMFVILNIVFIKQLNIKNKINYILCVSLIFISYFLVGIVRYHSLYRHHWLIFYTIISLLIILQSPFNNKLEKLKPIHYFLATFLLFSLSHYSFILPELIQRKVSMSKNVAEYLDSYYPEKDIIAKYDFFVEPVVAYRKKIREFYSLDRQEFIKYVVWDKKSVNFTNFKDHIVFFKNSDLLNQLNNVPENLLEHEPILVLSANKIVKDIYYKDMEIKGKYLLKQLKNFNGSLRENYSVFLVQKVKI